MTDWVFGSWLLQQSPPPGAETGATGGLIGAVVGLLALVCYWRVFSKAGVPGWRAIIPIWNVLTLFQIVGRPWWWLLLMFVPFVNFFIVVITQIDLGKSFGRSTLFSVLFLILLPFVGWLVLAFGDSEYVGPRGQAAATA